MEKKMIHSGAPYVLAGLAVLLMPRKKREANHE